MKRIGLIDYGAGNLMSVRHAFASLGAEILLLEEAPKEASFDALVLPGVGNFGSGMEELEKRGFSAFVKDWFASDRPFLGICLGMQFLMESSEECPGKKGLCLVKGDIRRFEPTQELKVPQIGWNIASPSSKDNPLFKGLPERPYFYFVHSYYCRPNEKDWQGSASEYGFKYCSSLWQGSRFAVQFHPEKSQKNGLAMLNNFISLI